MALHFCERRGHSGGAHREIEGARGNVSLCFSQPRGHHGQGMIRPRSPKEGHPSCCHDHCVRTHAGQGVRSRAALVDGSGTVPMNSCTRRRAKDVQLHETSLGNRQRNRNSWHHLHPRSLPLLVLLLVAMSLFPPSSSSPAAPPPPAHPPLPSPPPALANPNLIQWFYGSPQASSFIGEGDTLTWLWFDSKPHSLEGADAASQKIFSGGPGLGENVVSQFNFTVNVTFPKKGTYNYQCHQHPYVMLGTVYVKPKLNFGGVELPWFLGITYSGASAVVYVGDTVSWRWADDLPHGLTAQNGDQTMFTGPGSNNNTASGVDTFVFKKKFLKAGVYLYKCQNHGLQMRGNITVLPKPGQPNPPSGPPAPTAPSNPAPKGKASPPPCAKGKGCKTPAPPPSPPPPHPPPPKKAPKKGKGKK